MNDDPWPPELLQRAIAGDGCAFDMLIQPLLDPGFRLAMTMLRDRPAAEDAVQDAALKAWRHLDRFRVGAPPVPWFLAIVANECRSARRGRWWGVLKDWPVVAAPSLADPADRVDLQRALDRLPRRDLLLLTLYYHLDLPIEQVAAVLRTSPGAVKVRLHRIRQALRPALEVEA